MACEVWNRLRREEQQHREEWAHFAHSRHLHGQESLKAQQLATECMMRWREVSRRIALHMGGTCPIALTDPDVDIPLSTANNSVGDRYAEMIDAPDALNRLAARL